MLLQVGKSTSQLYAVQLNSTLRNIVTTWWWCWKELYNKNIKRM